MYQRRFVLALACVLLCGVSGWAAAQPNIVLIISDDHNWRDYSFTGTSSVLDRADNPVQPLTPNIDSLFSQGIAFNSSYCPVGVCRPSLASLYTGLNPVQSDITGNDGYTLTGTNYSRSAPTSDLNNILRRNIELNATLPRLLGEQGYLSLQTGKWWEGDYQRAGFTHGLTTDGSRHIGAGDNNTIGRLAGSIESRIGGFVDEALAADKPFFVSYAPLLPHSPHDAAPSFMARYNDLVTAGEITQAEAKYLAMVDWFDSTVGELRTTIQDRGVDNDTLYVYVTDNGYLAGGAAHLGASGAKRTPFDDGVRTPIMFYQPGQIEDGSSIADKLNSSAMASSLDIMPTLLALTGVAAPETLQGIDLFSQERHRVFGDTYGSQQVVLHDGEYRIGTPEDTRTSRFMIEGQWKIILTDSTTDPFDPDLGDAVQLYNLALDPGEKNNLAGAEAQRVTQMTTTLETWWAGTRPTYHYAHEFNGGTSGLNGQASDVFDTSHAAVRWQATAGIRQNGQIDGGSTAQLDFTPESGKRYELRAGITATATSSDGIVLGFLDDSAASGSPEDNALAWLLLRNDPTGLDLSFFAQADGGVSDTLLFDGDDAGLLALTLVLKTTDNDESLSGDQWAIELLFNGISVHEHIFTKGNPDIEHIGIGGLGTTPNLGTIDYLQLVETPLLSSTMVVPEPGSLCLLGACCTALLGRRR